MKAFLTAATLAAGLLGAVASAQAAPVNTSAAPLGVSNEIVSVQYMRRERMMERRMMRRRMMERRMMRRRMMRRM